jgi:hypothetical protein
MSRVVGLREADQAGMAWIDLETAHKFNEPLDLGHLPGRVFLCCDPGWPEPEVELFRKVFDAAVAAGWRPTPEETETGTTPSPRSKQPADSKVAEAPQSIDSVVMESQEPTDSRVTDAPRPADSTPADLTPPPVSTITDSTQSADLKSDDSPPPVDSEVDDSPQPAASTVAEPQPPASTIGDSLQSADSEVADSPPTVDSKAADSPPPPASTTAESEPSADSKAANSSPVVDPGDADASRSTAESAKQTHPVPNAPRIAPRTQRRSFAGATFDGDMRDPRQGSWLATVELTTDRLHVTRLEATGRSGLQAYLRNPDSRLMKVEAIGLGFPFGLPLAFAESLIGGSFPEEGWWALARRLERISRPDYLSAGQAFCQSHGEATRFTDEIAGALSPLHRD